MADAEVRLMPEAFEDFQALDGSAKLIVLNALRKLKNSPDQRGQPLGSNLTGFRRAIVDNRTYRIIFRVESDNTVCVVTVIAERADDAVRWAARCAGRGFSAPETPAMCTSA